MTRRRITAACALLALGLPIAFGGGCGRTPRIRRPDPALAERMLQQGERERSYLFYAPTDADPATPHALVLVFHGGGGDATSAARLTGFRDVADRQGFLVAYPNAVGGHWNDGRDHDFAQSVREGVDDVAFVDAVLEDVARHSAIDPRRVYATGISNGAMFVHRLASERARRIAAIAPVAGGLAAPYAPRLAPAEPVSVLVVQGTDDPLVPYDGGSVARGGRGRIVSTDTTLRLWAERDGCDPTPVRERPPDLDPTDGCLPTLDTWSRCASGAEVALLRLDGGGHTWPGGPRYLPERAVGRVCRDFDATRRIWEFFAAHPKSG